jgi:hypothetical protein
LAALVFLLFIGCATDDGEERNRGGFGELIREGYPNEINPFGILKKTANGLQPLEGGATILAEDVDDYYPLRLAGAPYAYTITLNVSAKHYTEDKYLISLRTLTADWKDCSEPKEVTFYRMGEEDGIAEYRSRKPEKNDEGFFEGVHIFFAQKEMPSVDWYKVLKVCTDGKGFRLEGVVL